MNRLSPPLIYFIPADPSGFFLHPGDRFVKHFLEQASDSIPRNTKMRLLTMLKSTNLDSIPSWLRYTNTKSELSRFLNNLNIDCESDQSKVENFNSLSSLIFDNIVQAQLFDDRILKDEKLGKKILKKINSITGDQITLDEDPKNFSEGVQKLVANIVYPWLDKSTTDQDAENDPQSEINNISEEKQLSKISFKPKPSWLEKCSTDDYNSITDNTLNNDSKILNGIENNTSKKIQLIDNEKNKNKSGEKKSKEKKSKKKKSAKKKSNKRHTRYVSKKKKEPFTKNLQSKSDSLLLETPIISDVNQVIPEEKQVSKLSSKPKPPWLDKSGTDFHDNSSQAHAVKKKQFLNDLNEKNVRLSKEILPELKFDTTKGGKLNPSNLQDDPAKKNLIIDEYDEDNVPDNKEDGMISNIDNQKIHLDTSRSIYNSKINDINKTDSKPINGERKKVIYSVKIMNKLMKFKSKRQNNEKNKGPSSKSKVVSSSDNDSSYSINPTTVKIKKLKESFLISRKGKLVSKIKVKPEKFKRSTPIPGKEKLNKKSNVVSNKTGKKKPSVKKTKKIGKLPIVSKKRNYFDDDTVREFKRPADEVLLKSISHTIFENNNEFNTKPMQQSYSTNENKNDYLKKNVNKNVDLGENYMENKTNINKNIFFYDKENNKKLSVTSNDNKTRSIDQNFRGDKFIVNNNIPVEYQKHNKLTNRVQDNKNVDIKPNSVDGKPNVNEYKIVYDKDNNKLANKPQNTNKGIMNIGQNSMDEKKNVVENKTVYDKDYNSLTNTNTDQVNEIKNIIPNFIDENKNINEKITSSVEDYNKLTNKAQHKGEMNLERKPVDEKKNVNEYSTVRDKDYNILTDQYNDKKNIITNLIDKNKNVNENITSFDREYNNLTSKAQDKYKNNSKQKSMDETMNVNKYKTVHDKDSDKFTDIAQNKNKTDKAQKLVNKKMKTIDEKNIMQNFIDENTNVNEKITNFDKEYNDLTNIAQGKEKKNIKQKSIDDKNNVDEYNTIHDHDYNKLTNIPQDNNTTDKEQKLRDEKTNIHEYKTVYGKDYNTLTNTDHYNEKKNITPNFIDENMNINENNINFNNDFNQITNKAQNKDKNIGGQKPMDEKTNVNEYSTDRIKDYNTLTNTIGHNDKESIKYNYLDENMNVNEKITNFDKDYNKLTNKFQDKDKNIIEKKPMDQKINVNGYKTVYDKDYDTLTNIDRYNDKIKRRTNYLDENTKANEKKTIYDESINKLTYNSQGKNKRNIGQDFTDENTYTNENINIYDKDCNKYRYNSVRTDDHRTRPLKSLSPIRVVDRKIVNNRKTAVCKTDNTKITHLDSNNNKLSKTRENRLIKCNEVRKNLQCNNVNNEILDKIEKKFKSRIMDDKIFWEKWIKRASMNCIKSFKTTRAKEGSKYRYATDEIKIKTLMEYEELRKNPGIIYQIRKKDGSNFSLCKTVLPLYEIRDSSVDKYSDYCNDIRLSKLCGNIHPIITGPPMENDSKLSERLEDLDSWEHNYDKCICQNKLTKMCSVDDKLFEPKYFNCKNQKKML